MSPAVILSCIIILQHGQGKYCTGHIVLAASKLSLACISGCKNLLLCTMTAVTAPSWKMVSVRLSTFYRGGSYLMIVLNFNTIV